MFLVLGLGTGAVYAALGLGLVLGHRASGVVNFAHGAMAAYATYVFVELRSAGDLVLPVVGLPGRFHVGDRLPFWACLGAALVVASLLGVVAHVVVFRPLRRAPALARVVASVGVLVVLQAVIVLRFGTANRPVAPVLPAEPVTVAGAVVPRDRLLLAAVAVAAAAALWALYRFSRFGLASRAVADDAATAASLGTPVERVAAANWALAGLLAGLGGILVAPITALNPTTYTLLVVPALAAALVGRLSSFAVTAAAALALGMAQSELVHLQARFDWVPRVGLQQGLPLLVIVVAMALAGRRVPDRSEPAGRRLPRARPARHITLPAALGLAAAAIGLFTLRGGDRLGLITSLIAAGVCLSLVLLTGWLGQISLAHMAFAGMAGFTLTKLGDGAGVPFPIAPLLAATVAAATGVLLALPALRLRGVDLAVATLAAAVAVEELVFRNPGLTGGFGGSEVPSPTFLGIGLGIDAGGDYPSPVFGVLVLAAVAAMGVALAAARRRGTGRLLLAVRANERAAAVAGVGVTAVKLGGFAASAFMAGAAGALLGYSQRQLSYGSFGSLVSLSFLALAFVGGITTVSGAFVGGALAAGGIVFTLLDHIAGWGRYQSLVTGLGLVAAAVAWPDGLAGAAQRLTARRRRPAPTAGAP
ncbi:MAG TPA: ABC transporter permease [Acidimicrobiales bacterium]|nr:ABC transporter permease [Acidimicrobiales bacterium]